MTTWHKRFAAAAAEAQWMNADPNCPVCGGNGWEYIIERNHDGFAKENRYPCPCSPAVRAKRREDRAALDALETEEYRNL